MNQFGQNGVNGQKNNLIDLGGGNLIDLSGNIGNGLKGVASVQEFQQSASDIACYNDNPSQVFSTLRSVAKKLLKDDVRYRTLDTTNPKVMERLIGFEGVLDFLVKLGFESDAVGAKLICKVKPSANVVHNAITVLNSYQQRFRMTQGGPMNMMQMNMMQYNNPPPMAMGGGGAINMPM